MSALREAAQAVVDRWDSPLWKDVAPTGQFINRLRAALAAPEPAAPVGVWSKEPPTGPGLYWWSWVLPSNQAEVVDVFFRGGELLCVGIADREEYSVKKLGGEWYSIPITPPEVK